MVSTITTALACLSAEFTMKVANRGYWLLDLLGKRHLAWFVVAHAMLHRMPDQLVICEEDAMSSSMPMLNVMKTNIEGKQLAPNPRHSLKTAPLEKPDASTTEYNAAPCRR
ncbi:hypothetical protein T4B_8375 [Trichinella pseudospiralis]|uniref:Uncharacterized protein n=1 Tax=Trichinella pseudospiralis TaxID=6337 RepID=A0A0V1DU39_TRIPS|nr:hypothetical protein T4A_4869 [Trichinella pseudospiralis]KRZ05924.1 hypothetical protein T4B_8375 [Trichinella pseudospiralis]